MTYFRAAKIAKLAEDAVTVTAGTGLTGGGEVTLGSSATLNVIGGDGMECIIDYTDENIMYGSLIVTDGLPLSRHFYLCNCLISCRSNFELLW